MVAILTSDRIKFAEKEMFHQFEKCYRNRRVKVNNNTQSRYSVAHFPFDTYPSDEKENGKSKEFFFYFNEKLEKLLQIQK